MISGRPGQALYLGGSVGVCFASALHSLCWYHPQPTNTLPTESTNRRRFEPKPSCLLFKAKSAIAVVKGHLWAMRNKKRCEMGDIREFNQSEKQI